MLEYEMLMDLEEELSERLKYDLPGILISLNRNERLRDWLDLMGMGELFPVVESTYKPYNTGKIVILGGTSVKEKDIIGLVKQLGIEKDRLECCLDYESTVTFNYKKMMYDPNYSLILVGPIPHSTSVKGDFSSAVVAMEKTEGYPPVIRLGSNGLKISKSGIKEALIRAMGNGLLAA